MAEVAAIIAAAGSGQRMGNATPKQFLPLAGKPVLAHTLDIFESDPLINRIILVVNEGDIDYCQREIIYHYGFSKIVEVVPGGAERQYSVANALRTVPPEVAVVAVHDGARPFLAPAVLKRAVEAALSGQAVVVAVPVKDTIKIAGADQYITGTPDRRQLWAVQTPQVFPRQILESAYRQAFAEQFLATDDATLVERAGYPVLIVEGTYRNFKITTPEDLLLAEALLKDG